MAHKHYLRYMTDDEIFALGSSLGKVRDIAIAHNCDPAQVRLCRSYLLRRHFPLEQYKKNFNGTRRKSKTKGPAPYKIKTLTFKEWIEELKAKKRGE